MVSYNQRLFVYRTDNNLSIKQMAALLQINRLHYRLLEAGYWRPKQKLIAKISEVIGEDYGPYLKGLSSYPTHVKNEKTIPFVHKINNFMAKKATRIALLSLFGLSIGGAIGSALGYYHLSNHTLDCYDSSFVSAMRKVQLYGAEKQNIGGAASHEVFIIGIDQDEGFPYYYSIETGLYDEVVGSFKISATYRFNEFRLIYEWNKDQANTMSVISFKASALYYATSETATATFTIQENGIDFHPGKTTNPNIKTTASFEANYKEDLLVRAPYVIDDLNMLIESQSVIPLSLFELSVAYKTGNQKDSFRTGILNAFRYITVILSALFAFSFIYSRLHADRPSEKTALVVAPSFVPSAEEADFKPLPIRDLSVGPPLFEGLLRTVGIAAIFAGALRLIVYVISVVHELSISNLLHDNFSSSLNSLFMMGLFLLYFIDFDLIRQERRTLRIVFQNLIFFITLYALEAMLLDQLPLSSSMAFSLIDFNALPNMFGSVACYFMVMLFLFVTPKRLTKRYQIVVFRSLVILPIGWIVTAFVLFHGDEAIFNLNWPYWAKMLFNGDAIAISSLAILYLVAMFFLRIHYQRKYGPNLAELYFGSNRYLWTKNIIAVAILVVICGVEFWLGLYPALAKMGFGKNPFLICLAPFLLLYHPRKGERSELTDFIAMHAYGLCLLIAYSGVAVMGLYGLIR